MSDRTKAVPGNLWNRLWNGPHVLTVRRFSFLTMNAYSDPSFDFLSADFVIRTGMVVVGVFVIGFLGWAALAPLDSALVAQGVVVVETHRKTIQHLEGGIVRNIYVAEGQKVAAGQQLIQLDDTESKASLDLVRGQADALAAQQARLEAERDNADKIAFPPELLARQDDPKVAEAIRGEQNTFDTHRATLAKQQDIYNQRISENKRIIAGLESQQTSVEQQSQLIGQESDSVQQLYNKGLSTLPQLLQLKRQAANWRTSTARSPKRSRRSISIPARTSFKSSLSATSSRTTSSRTCATSRPNASKRSIVCTRRKTSSRGCD